MASGCAEFVWENPNLGGYLKCILLGEETNIFRPVMYVGGAIAIILTLFLLRHTLRNLDNAKELQTIGQKWLYLALFIVVIVSGLGLIFFVFGLLGFDKSAIITMFTELLDSLDTTNNP